ncbi:hypothetical protein IVB34_12625 [Bradyrhizobium sp. 2]|uniref:hypothetical protein n=1 Tax=Bradyrhizobium sp. 2 TaxID=190045 RepID=UPI001FFA1B44|nr:hypothetical protein [Bradyrhizobium sp. 2]MCK1459200.1 hypothetical protein [Bradyrhizobium sp. 2]
MAKTFDPYCYELAAAFLKDEPDLNTEAARITLAAEIQEAIEAELFFMRSQLKAARNAA